MSNSCRVSADNAQSIDFNVDSFVREVFFSVFQNVVLLTARTFFLAHLRSSLRPPSRHSEGAGSCPPVSPAQDAHC